MVSKRCLIEIRLSYSLPFLVLSSLLGFVQDSMSLRIPEIFYLEIFFIKIEVTKSKSHKNTQQTNNAKRNSRMCMMIMVHTYNIYMIYVIYYDKYADGCHNIGDDDEHENLITKMGKEKPTLPPPPDSFPPYQ